MRKQWGKRKVFYQRIHVLHWAWGLTFVITLTLVTWLIHCFLLLFFYFFLLSILYFRFWFCVSVLSFVILFWVLCFCFGFCDSVSSFVFLFWVLWFCLEFCVSVLGFVILFWVLCFCIGFCDSVSSFVFLFWVFWSCFVQYRPPYVLIQLHVVLLYSKKRSTYTEQRPHHASEDRLQEANNHSKQWQHWKILKPSGRTIAAIVTEMSPSCPQIAANQLHL